MGIVSSDRQLDHSGETMADVESDDIGNHCSSDSNIRWRYLSGDPDLYLRLPVNIISQGEASREKSPVAHLLYYRSPSTDRRRPVPYDFHNILWLDRFRSKANCGGCACCIRLMRAQVSEFQKQCVAVI